MACFLVPAAEAVVVTAAKKTVAIKSTDESTGAVAPAKVPFLNKLKWLTNLLWGGAVLLAFEHVWHGEVVPWFPFLTAASNPADTAEMLHEMSTIGVSMAAIITVVWGIMLVVVNAKEKEQAKLQTEAAE